MEKSTNQLTRTKANNAAEAPYPLNAGHDGEVNDLERMMRPAAVCSTPAVYMSFCVSVCACACVVVHVDKCSVIFTPLLGLNSP